MAYGDVARALAALCVFVASRTGIGSPGRLCFWSVMPTANAGRPWNAENTANAAGCAALYPGMAGDRSLREIGRIEPNVMLTSVMMQHASMRSHVAFQVPAIHESAFSFGSSGCGYPAEKPCPRLLKSLGSVPCIGKCLFNGLRLSDELRIER
jgi:hypothetical protein